MNRIMTYNIGNGTKHALNTKQFLNNVYGQITQIMHPNPNDLLLQEANRKKILNTDYTYIDYLMKYTGYKHGAYSSHSNSEVINSGIAIFSQDPGLWITKDNPNATSIIGLSNRKFIIYRKPIDGNRYLVIINLHLIANFEKLQLKQLKYIMMLAKKEMELNNEVIIGGDFNFEMFSSKKNEVLTQKKDLIFKSGFNYGEPDNPTFNKNKYYDWFLYTNGIDILNIKSAFNFDFSNHTPVTMEYKLK